MQHVKNLTINDVHTVQYPVFKASDVVEQAYQEAKKAEKKNELIPVVDLDDFFNSL